MLTLRKKATVVIVEKKKSILFRFFFYSNVFKGESKERIVSESEGDRRK